MSARTHGRAGQGCEKNSVDNRLVRSSPYKATRHAYSVRQRLDVIFEGNRGALSRSSRRQRVVKTSHSYIMYLLLPISPPRSNTTGKRELTCARQETAPEKLQLYYKYNNFDGRRCLSRVLLPAPRYDELLLQNFQTINTRK